LKLRDADVERTLIVFLISVDHSFLFQEVVLSKDFVNFRGAVVGRKVQKFDKLLPIPKYLLILISFGYIVVDHNSFHLSLVVLALFWLDDVLIEALLDHLGKETG
jgi:hypothetical protein